MASKEIFEYKDSNLDDISEGEEAFIVSSLMEEEKEQCDFIQQGIIKSKAHGKQSKDFTERVQCVTSISNPGLPKVFAEQLMHDVAAVSGEQSKQGED